MIDKRAKTKSLDALGSKKRHRHFVATPTPETRDSCNCGEAESLSTELDDSDLRRAFRRMGFD